MVNKISEFASFINNFNLANKISSFSQYLQVEARTYKNENLTFRVNRICNSLAQIHQALNNLNYELKQLKNEALFLDNYKKGKR